MTKSLLFFTSFFGWHILVEQTKTNKLTTNRFKKHILFFGSINNAIVESSKLDVDFHRKFAKNGRVVAIQQIWCLQLNGNWKTMLVDNAFL